MIVFFESQQLIPSITSQSSLEEPEVKAGEKGKGIVLEERRKRGWRGPLPFYLQQQSHPNDPPLPQETFRMPGYLITFLISHTWDRALLHLACRDRDAAECRMTHRTV